MIRTLLATTAVASLIATGALAQTQTQNAPASSAASDTQPQSGMKSADQIKAPAATQEQGHLASQLMGKSVYNGTGNNAKDIGDVNNIVIGDNGKVKSVVVGVGGFLGMGEKNVAIDYNEVKWVQQNGSWTVMVPTTTDQLKALPNFDTSVYDADHTAGTNTSANNTVQPANGGMTAPATGTVATTTGTAATGTATNTTDNNETASVDKNSLKKVDVSAISANDLIGTTVYGAKNADVGSVDDVVLNKSGKVDAVVVNVGGFLGIGSKQVAVGMTNLQFLADNNGKKYLYTHFTEKQLKAQPAYDKKTYAANRNKQRMTVE